MQAIGCFGKLVCLTASSRNQALSELSKLEQPTASPAHGRSRRSLAEAQDLAAAICHASAAERFSHTRVQAFVMQVVAQARFRQSERDTTTQQLEPETCSMQETRCTWPAWLLQCVCSSRLSSQCQCASCRLEPAGHTQEGGRMRAARTCQHRHAGGQSHAHMTKA